MEKLRQEKFESEKERIKEINRMEKKLLRSQIDQMRNEMQNMQDRFQRQLDRLEERRGGGGDSYHSDEFRILGEGLDKLARVIERKDIANKLIDAAERLAQMPRRRGQREQPPPKETESSKSSVPDLMLEAGGESLVEGGEAE